MGHDLLAITPAPPSSPPPPTSLALGFRFHPTDKELVQYYLKRRASGKPFHFDAVSEIDVYKSEPWELSENRLCNSCPLEFVSTMSTEKERETRVYMAKLADQAERYDEMVECMKSVAKLDVELTVDERNLLSVGYRNVIGARRASWRIMSSIEQKEESKGNENNVKLIKGYRHKVDEELSKICSDILTIIDKHLIPSSNSEFCSPLAILFHLSPLAMTAIDHRSSHRPEIRSHFPRDIIPGTSFPVSALSGSSQ